jgi:hypothetical protein
VLFLKQTLHLYVISSNDFDGCKFGYLCKTTIISLMQCKMVVKKVSSSSSFPVLGLLRPVTGVTKLNLFIFSKVFLNFFSLLVGILESFLGSSHSSSCQHALSNFSYTGIPCCSELQLALFHCSALVLVQ